MWQQHLDESPPAAAGGAFDDPLVDAFDDEHQEPVARAAARGPPRERDLPLLRRHKDLTPEDIDLSSKLWRWGFFFLPFLWLVNYYFFRHSLASPATPETMKRDVRRSLVAFGVAATLWIIWLIVFYTNMHGWAHPMMLFSPSTNVLD